MRGFFLVLAVALGLAGASVAEARKFDTVAQVSAADETFFWAIIDRTVPFAGDQDQQVAALRAELDKLNPQQIERFGRVFGAILHRSYTWDLWGAAYVIMGGASDDGFEYFRVWLVSRGRKFFNAAVADPDSLARLIPSDFNDVPEFELLAYVGREVWTKKVGREPEQEIVQPEMVYPGSSPAGAPFSEDEGGLARRYPALWKRFGHTPLG